MQINNLKPKQKNKQKKRIGRGGKKGTYSGKGVKGQRSRAGRRMQPSIREMIKRYPKLRGYRNKTYKKFAVAVNLLIIDKHFQQGEIVSPDSLLEKKVITKMKGKVPKVKILGTGEITKKLIFEKMSLSESAKQKIEKAGGTVK